MGLSIRAYARHRGVSHVAVKKAIDSGRISQLTDGTIDPELADEQWAHNTMPTRSPKDPSHEARPIDLSEVSAVAQAKGLPSPGKSQAAKRSISSGVKEPQDLATAALPSGGTSLLQARTVNEVLKAQLNKVELAQRKKELVDRAQAIAHVFKLARVERDAWLNWPARVAGQLASELGVESHALHVALEAAVRDHLQELGEMRPRVD